MIQCINVGMIEHNLGEYINFDFRRKAQLTFVNIIGDQLIIYEVYVTNKVEHLCAT